MIWKYADEAKLKIKAGGMVPNETGEQLQAQLEKLARECRQWVYPYLKGKPRLLEGVSLIYIYHFDQKEQGRFNDCLGLCTKYSDKTAVIGVADELLQYRDYDNQLTVFLHEVAHLEDISHSQAFVKHLDRIIAEFNRATGRKLVNETTVYAKHEDSMKRFRADQRSIGRDAVYVV